MRIGRKEIIEELTEHIRASGGEPSEWRVGTAEGQWLGEMERFKIQNSRETPASMAGLAYREAHTTYAADDAVDYLVSAFGLKLAPQAERCAALQNPRAWQNRFRVPREPAPPRRARQRPGHVAQGRGLGASGRSPSWGHGQDGRGTRP